MSRREPICPERRRRVPEGFGWVDHRLVRDGHFMNCDDGALALYLFLITVGNADGVSWYSDESLSVQLNCGESEVAGRRRRLVDAGLIAWRRPVCQVLDLNPATYDERTFSHLLREAVRRNSGFDPESERKNDACRMVPLGVRVPEDHRATRRLGDVIGDMIGEDGQ